MVVAVVVAVVVGAFGQFLPSCSSSPSGQSTKVSHTQSMGIQWWPQQLNALQWLLLQLGPLLQKSRKIKRPTVTYQKICPLLDDQLLCSRTWVTWNPDSSSYWMQVCLPTTGPMMKLTVIMTRINQTSLSSRSTIFQVKMLATPAASVFLLSFQNLKTAPKSINQNSDPTILPWPN